MKRYTEYLHAAELAEITNLLTGGLVSVTEAAFKALDLGYHIQSVGTDSIVYNRTINIDAGDLDRDDLEDTSVMECVTIARKDGMMHLEVTQGFRTEPAFAATFEY